MSDQERKIYEETRKAVEDVRMKMVSVQDYIEAAAECCRGTEMEDHLNSQWDAIEDLRFDLAKQMRAFHDRLAGKDEQRESWAEALLDSFPKVVGE